MPARSLYLVRHGQTDWNLEGKFQGTTDVPLNEQGLADARIAAEFFQHHRVDKIVASPLQRATATAQIIAEAIGVPLSTDERLKEVDGGRWEGQTFSQLRAEGDTFERWRAGVEGAATDGGETRKELAQRFCAGVSAALEGLDDDAVVMVVAHGAAIRAALPLLLDLPETHWHVFAGMRNCHFHRLNYQPINASWQLAQFNSAPHKD